MCVFCVIAVVVAILAARAGDMVTLIRTGITCLVLSVWLAVNGKDEKE
jgi:hypothetical protein